MSKSEVAPREMGEKAAAVKDKQGDFSFFIRPAGKEPSGQDCPSKACRCQNADLPKQRTASQGTSCGK